MKIPPVELSYIEETFSAAADDVADAFEVADRAQASRLENTPEVVSDAMHKLLQIFKSFESERESGNLPDRAVPGERVLSRSDLLALGNYGLNLLAEMSKIAATLRVERRSRDLEALCFPLALWIVRNGGEISTLEPVVNALAQVANRFTKQADLEQLYFMVGELVEAVTPSLSEDLERSNPMRPWRVLLLNWGIIATRSYRPQLMNQAFRAIIEHIPEDAPEFFRQGMEQMEALDYPGEVRRVMTEYFEAWNLPKTLH